MVIKRFLFVVFSMCLALPVYGQGADQEWLVACKPTKECQMQQFIEVGGQQISRLLVYKVDDTEVLEFLVPLGINLQRPPVIQIDDKPARPTQMLECEVPGCRGFVTIDRELRTQMKRGLVLKLFIGNFKTKQELSINFTLLGFTKGYKVFSEGSE